MTDPFARVAEALDTARAAWALAASPGSGVDGLTGAPLVALNEATAGLRKQVDAVFVQVAAQVARASRPELGNAGLARQQGSRTPAALIAVATGGSTGEAARLIAVGEATAPRATLTGAAMPPKRPAVASAVDRGRISVDAAAAIVALLDKVALRAGPQAIAEAETTLVEKAAGLRLDEVHKLLQRAEAWLDPDGVAPREDELRSETAVHVREDRSGILHVNGKFDPETGAPIKAAIEAIVGASLRQRDDQGETPTAGATVVVRIGLEQLETGTGYGTIEASPSPSRSAPSVAWQPQGRSSRVCSTATARSSTSAGPGAASASRRSSRSPNATAGVQGAGSHRT